MLNIVAATRKRDDVVLSVVEKVEIKALFLGVIGFAHLMACILYGVIGSLPAKVRSFFGFCKKMMEKMLKYR